MKFVYNSIGAFVYNPIEITPVSYYVHARVLRSNTVKIVFRLTCVVISPMTGLLFGISAYIGNPTNSRTASNGPFAVDVVVGAETSSPIALVIARCSHIASLSYRVALFLANFQFILSDTTDGRSPMNCFRCSARIGRCPPLRLTSKRVHAASKVVALLLFDASNANRVPVSRTQSFGVRWRRGHRDTATAYGGSSRSDIGFLPGAGVQPVTDIRPPGLCGPYAFSRHNRERVSRTRILSYRAHRPRRFAFTRRAQSIKPSCATRRRVGPL